MSTKSIVGLVGWAVALGLVVALFAGGERVVSVEVWLAGFAAWLGISILRQFFTDVQLPRVRLRGQWSMPRRAPPATPDGRPQDLRSTEVLLHRAGTNERAHEQQLRPRLTELADHYLVVHHGLDPARQPEQVAELLGDTAWLIDETPNGRRPSLDDITRFLDRIVAASTSAERSP